MKIMRVLDNKEDFIMKLKDTGLSVQDIKDKEKFLKDSLNEININEIKCWGRISKNLIGREVLVVE